MQMNKLSVVGVAGIVVGILGVIGPIAWDYYKSKAEIELRVVERSVIISKPTRLEGLLITYNGKPLDELSKTAFSVVNTGRTPILKKDVASPIFVKFAKQSNIIDAKLDGMQPPDLDASLKFVKEDGRINLEFPLLNPGDKIDFSVLAKSGAIEFEAGGRIAGLASLTVKKALPQDKSRRTRPWTIYPVGFFSALLALVSMVGFSRIPEERRIKARIKTGTFQLPNLKSKIEWLAWVNSTFRFTTDNERAPLSVLLRELPDSDDFATVHREKIVAGIHELLHRAASNFAMATIVITIAAAGGWYVFSNL